MSSADNKKPVDTNHLPTHQKIEPYLRALREGGPIFSRHVFVLVNGILFAVVVLLFVFNETQAAFFLGFIFIANTLVGIIQDFQARVALERLQLLTAQRVRRINADSTESLIFIEEVRKGDRVALRIGEQVPCDGTVIVSKGLEVSEALLTGESESLVRSAKAQVSAGSIVTSGRGEVLVENVWSQSRIAKMTKDVKQYVASPSPIERSTEKIITISGYILIGVVGVVLLRGHFTHESGVAIVNHIGALASVIVPQGLIVITTLLFAFGAASYSKRQVLFQEINATEKLGRIKNLCMDKTGTLTDNTLSVESIHVPQGGNEAHLRLYTAAYVKGSEDRSSTMRAASQYLGESAEVEILESVGFSSWRQFGAVRLSDEGHEVSALIGSPDVFLPHLASESEAAWLSELIETYSKKGKRILFVVTSRNGIAARKLEGKTLAAVGAFVFENNLREGIRDAIDFFQNRGIRIRLLSGDNPETVRAIAALAGVRQTELAITGKEMEPWSKEDYMAKAKAYTIFARVSPEQKVKLIDAFKREGFTAMVGDGANDALAIKRSDLGIAMFDGAPATRQLAGVVLMNNSFVALPGAVRLADNFIGNIEIFASIFLNQSIVGFYFFVILVLFGFPFPLTPLNITLINYFTVGLPGLLISYWAIRPRREARQANTMEFIKRILPFPLFVASLQALGVGLVFAMSPEYMKHEPSNMLVAFAFIGFGFLFATLAPGVYGKRTAMRQKVELGILLLVECLLLVLVFVTPFLTTFFDITIIPNMMDIGKVLVIVLFFGSFMYEFTEWFISRKAK